jgi:hypothetical protein
VNPGTIIDYKRLSHAGTKVRGNEVLDARKRVSHRPQGVIPNITAPVHVKSFTEEMGTPRKQWFEGICRDVAEYRRQRTADRKAHEAKLLAMIAKA